MPVWPSAKPTAIVALFARAGVDFLRSGWNFPHRDVRIGGPSRQIRAARDQACAPFVRHVGPRPLNENQQPVAETDEKKDVHEEPGQPRDEAGDVDFAEIGDRGGAADGSQAAFIPVVERWTRIKIPTLSRSAREGWGTRYFLRINFAT